MDIMDIANISMEMSQTQVLTDIGTAMLAKSLDTVRDAGAGMIDMMERSMMENSVNPNLGGNIDLIL